MKTKKEIGEIKDINFEEKEITIKSDIDSCIDCRLQLEKLKERI